MRSLTRRSFLALSLAFVSLPASAAQPPLRVLFIGNSYTYFNNLPEILEQLSQASKGRRRIKTAMVVAGGATLDRHWNTAAARQALTNGPWDYVVLQEQSSLGVPLTINGVPRITDWSRFHGSARLWAAEIKKAGAKTVFFLTWAATVAPEEQSNLTYAYMTIARELGAVVAPVGMAWQRMHRENPKVNLYFRDGAHPGPPGSYLSACVLYATLIGRSPAGLPSRIIGTAIDETGEARPGGKVTLVDLPNNDGALLQRAAWATYRELRKAGGYLTLPAPAPPQMPTMPTGIAASAGDYAGSWTGELKLSVVPIPLQLQLMHGESWRGDAILHVGSGGPDVNLTIAELVVGDDGMHFTASSQATGVIRFRAVLTAQGLAGIAEIINRDQRPTAISTWEMTRQQ